MKDACAQNFRDLVEKDVKIEELRSVLADLVDARNVEHRRISFLEKETDELRVALKLAQQEVERNRRLITSLTEKNQSLRLQLKRSETDIFTPLRCDEDDFAQFLDEQMATEKEEEESVAVRIRERSPSLEMEEILEQNNSKREKLEVPFTLRTYQVNLDREYEKNLNQQYRRMKDLHKAAKKPGRVGRKVKKALQFY